MKYFFCTLLTTFLFVSCDKKSNGNTSGTQTNDNILCTDLPENAATHFVPLLTDTLEKGVNSIYGVSSLLAWQQLKALDKNQLNVAGNYPELVRFNTSEDYKDALNKGEYATTVSYADGEEAQSIEVTASFSVNLPFAYKFTSYKNELTFKDKKVAAFGDMLDDKAQREVTWRCSSLKYYDSDDDFVLQLYPKDTTHEIFLCMLPKKPHTLKAALDTLNAHIAVQKKMKAENHSYWKNWFSDEDRILIPKLKFDFKSHHSAFEGATFSFGKSTLLNQIESFTQCIAFSLDEAGAKVYEQSDIVEAAVDMEQHPKNLFFNKPFLVIIRHTGSDSPYFAAWIENTDFMQKE